MISLTPSPADDGYQHVTIKADEPVTITVGAVSPTGTGHLIYVYRGVLADDDQETEPVAVYDGSMGHGQNRPIVVDMFIPAMPGDPIFWILDQEGATFAYDDEVMARTEAERAKRDGAVNLVLFRATVPGPVAEEGMLAVAEWAASNAAPDADAEYLTGNAEDIAAKDAEDDAGPLTIARSDGTVLGVVGPAYHVMTMTPEAERALAEQTPYFTDASVTVDGYTHRTAQDAADSLLGWLIKDATVVDDEVRVDVKDSNGGQHEVDVHPRRFLREHLIEQAVGLLDQSPGHVEYVRALTELICRACGINTDDKDKIRGAIMRRVTD